MLPPGFLSKRVNGIEREKQKTIQKLLVGMRAAGIENPSKLLFGSNQKSNGKGTDERKNKIGRGDGDDDYEPFNGEEGLSDDDDNDDVSRSKVKKLKRVTTNPNSSTCKLLDWMGTGEVVAEGRWSSSDPNDRVHHIPLGPNAMRVWVDVVKKREIYLWRPTSDMLFIEDAEGTTVAWPANKVLMDSTPGSMG